MGWIGVVKACWCEWVGVARRFIGDGEGGGEKPPFSRDAVDYCVGLERRRMGG